MGTIRFGKEPSQMNYIIDDPAYKEVVMDLKKQLKGLPEYYAEDRNLEVLKEVSEKDLVDTTSND